MFSPLLTLEKYTAISSNKEEVLHVNVSWYIVAQRGCLEGYCQSATPVHSLSQIHGSEGHSDARLDDKRVILFESLLLFERLFEECRGNEGTYGQIRVVKRRATVQSAVITLLLDS